MFDDIEDINELIAMRKKLRSALLNGVRSVSYNGQTTLFDRPEDIERAIGLLTAEIRRRDPEASQAPGVIYFSTASRG